ncbi:MAG: hypothetical protein ABI882_02340 [Acidobacteriota bacterium]
MISRSCRVLMILLVVGALSAMKPVSVRGWGPHGHALSGRVAAMKVPVDMPRFFRKSVDHLSYLNPEPDRWKDRVESDIDKAITSASVDHYIDLEYVPDGALNAPTRYDFGVEMVKAGRKATDAGFVPYRILELFQRLRIEFRLWRVEQNRTQREWIEQRIINDAGLLGHYVSDGANPHHTTIHHNGWVGANPNSYTVYSRENGFHYRFEDIYVRGHIQLNDVLPLVAGNARVLDKTREEIMAYLQRSHAKLEELYILDKKEAFGETTASLEHKKFASERLAAGAEMLRDLWWTAWVTSAIPSPAPTAQK